MQLSGPAVITVSVEKSARFLTTSNTAKDLHQSAILLFYLVLSIFFIVKFTYVTIKGTD